MSTDVEFLTEVASFLETEALLPEFSSSTPFEDHNGPSSIVPSTLIPLLDEDSLLKERNIENYKSGSDGEKSLPKKNNRQNDKAKARRLKYRLKTKSERDELHQLETGLTLRLHELLEARHRAITTARTDLVLSKTFWKDVAIRFRCQRFHAEAERKRLGAIVNSQASYIETLRASLSEPQGEFLGTKSPIIHAEYDTIDDLKWLRLKSSDEILYRTYLQEVNDAYSRFDQVFHECAINALPVNSICSIQRYDPDGLVGYLQYVNKFLRPCSFENASRSTWDISKLPHRRIDREDYEDMTDSGNTIAFKFRLKKTLPTGSTVSILKRVLVRRFHAYDHTMIIYKVFSEGEGIFSGMDVDETAWSRIQPYSDGSHNGSLVEVCSRQVPVQYITDNADDSVVKEFQSMLHDVVVEDVGEAVRCMEKSLRIS